MKRCKILRSLDRVFVFEFVLCIGAPSKNPARLVDLGFGILRNKRHRSTREFPRNKPQHVLCLCVPPPWWGVLCWCVPPPMWGVLRWFVAPLLMGRAVLVPARRGGGVWLGLSLSVGWVAVAVVLFALPG